MIIIVNFGGQYAHLIAKCIRKLNVKSEIISPDDDIPECNGVILSGGPQNVLNGTKMDLSKITVPILGICYGMQLIAHQYGQKIINMDHAEYGKTNISVVNDSLLISKSAQKTTTKSVKMSWEDYVSDNASLVTWMSHKQSVQLIDDQFKLLALTDDQVVAAIQHKTKPIYGVQFHPEVTHTCPTLGAKLLDNFVTNICRSKKSWDMKSYKDVMFNNIKDIVKDDHVLIGTSGGVDSTVLAVAAYKSLDSSQICCVHIDTGLNRLNESDQVEHYFTNILKCDNFHRVDAKSLFLDGLKGVTDPEEKRKIIGHTFIKVFEDTVTKLNVDFKWLAQGTIYPDRVESGKTSKHTKIIKTHHNLNLPDKMKMKVLEPLKELYKDEVRELGQVLEIPNELLFRHPFPGPGLGIRILGEVKPEYVTLLQKADDIFISTLKKHNYYNKTWQAFAAFIPVRTVGVKGDVRCYEHMISLRAVNSTDGMTADVTQIPWEILQDASTQITKLEGINRVVFDITEKPPGTIEYE
jgi:GMP synthase (glutamine-hydrolysing)